MPVQGTNRPARQITAGNTPRAKMPRATSGVDFQQFLRNWEQHISREQEKTQKLIEMSVMIHRRARALTLSDQCGRFGIRQDTQGRWLDYDADLDGEIHPINIVGPAINTNQNACLQSTSETLVESANQNAQNKQNAMRWQRVADYFERISWDESERSFIFDAVQKDGTLLIRSYRELAEAQTVPNVSEATAGLSVYQCEACGDSGLIETNGMPEGLGDIDCPQCRRPAKAITKAINAYELGESDIPVYQIKDEIIPFYNFTIDSYGAKIKGIQGAKFLQIQRLFTRMELESRYPGKDFGGAPENWSYPLRCDYALANGAWEYLNYSAMRESLPDFMKFEERSIYLHEDAYKSWIAPEDYKFVNARGRTTFQIKAGQTIGEAYEEMFGENPRGLKYVWMDQRLVDIASPEDEEVNFRDCFSDVHWRRDSGSYLSSPHYSIVTIQDDITLLNTMNHNIIARNAVNPVYYDSLVFEQADFSKEHIGSKNAHLLDDRDLQKSVVQLPVPTPSPYLSNQLQFLWGIKDDVTNVTPAMRGAAQSGETLGAVRQQLEQSYGMLTSVLKSFAKCKNDVFKQKAKIAQKVWTAEQFQRVASMFGELWSDADVQEMCEVDIDADLIVSYKSGSEMPQSNLDRQMRFFSGLEQLFRFPPEVLFQMLGQEKIAKILEQIDSFANFNFDLTGLEVNELIAQKRYLELAEICANQGPIGFEQIEAMKQKIAAVDQEGQAITALDLLTEQIFAESQIRFSQYEDLPQQQAFFIEQLRAETGKTQPNYLLIEMLHVILGFLQQAQMQMAEEALANDPNAKAQAEAEKANAEREAKNAEREDANRQADRDAAAESEAVKAALSLTEMAAQQQHEAEMAKGRPLASEDADR